MGAFATHIFMPETTYQEFNADMKQLHGIQDDFLGIQSPYIEGELIVICTVPGLTYITCGSLRTKH
jgi:hypothetical protein